MREEGEQAGRANGGDQKRKERIQVGCTDADMEKRGGCICKLHPGIGETFGRTKEGQSVGRRSGKGATRVGSVK